MEHRWYRVSATKATSVATSSRRAFGEPTRDRATAGLPEARRHVVGVWITAMSKDSKDAGLIKSADVSGL